MPKHVTPCSRYGWFVTYSRRSSVEGPGVSCVHGVHCATHKAVYRRSQHLQQLHRDKTVLSYKQSRIFYGQECGSGKNLQTTNVPLPKEAARVSWPFLHWTLPWTSCCLYIRKYKNVNFKHLRHVSWTALKVIWKNTQIQHIEDACLTAQHWYLLKYQRL
jgi:hypothetical protein